MQVQDETTYWKNCFRLPHCNRFLLISIADTMQKGKSITIRVQMDNEVHESSTHIFLTTDTAILNQLKKLRYC